MNKIEYLRKIKELNKDGFFVGFFDYIDEYDSDIRKFISEMNEIFTGMYIRYNERPEMFKLMLEGIDIIVNEFRLESAGHIKSTSDEYVELLSNLYWSNIPPFFKSNSVYYDIVSKKMNPEIRMWMYINKIFDLRFDSNKMNIDTVKLILEEALTLPRTIYGTELNNAILMMALQLDFNISDYLTYRLYIKRCNTHSGNIFNSRLLSNFIPENRKIIYNSIYIQNMRGLLSTIVYEPTHKLGNRFIKRMNQGDISRYITIYMYVNNSVPDFSHLNNKSINKILNALIQLDDRLRLHFILAKLKQSGIKVHFDIFNLDINKECVIGCNKKKGIFMNNIHHYNKIRKIKEYNDIVDELKVYKINLVKLNENGKYSVSDDILDKTTLINEYNLLVDKLSTHNIIIPKLRGDIL